MYLNQIPSNSEKKNFSKKKYLSWFIVILPIIAFSFFYANWISDPKMVVKKEHIEIIEKPIEEPAPIIIREAKEKFIPQNFTMETIKKKGCVVDGFLSEYGDDTEELIAMINRSECGYLHRALETWRDAPDFNRAQEIMVRVKKPMVFGMFIAEAISRKVRYHNPETGENFDFKDMCKDGTENVWGEHSCKANLEEKEYREYLKFITKRAMDAGIQSFLFGQIYFQEGNNLKNSKLPEIIQDMHDYAKEKKLQIIIGAQTGSITDENYLRMFDYIEGGVGMNDEGSIESGACLSWRGGCWALLWNQRFKSKANNVLLHLDWSGIESDDMSRFARMDKETRSKTLSSLYQYFTSRDMGFLIPFYATLYRENEGCHGESKKFYSASNKYECQDEDVINAILKGTYKP